MFYFFSLWPHRTDGEELALQAHGEVCGSDVVAGGNAVGEGVLTLTVVQVWLWHLSVKNGNRNIKNRKIANFLYSLLNNVKINIT